VHKRKTKPPVHKALQTSATAEVAQFCYGLVDAAALVGLGTTLLKGQIKSGELKAFKVGDRLLISREALLEWIARREAASAA
jgi:excisionase family DNA binding protein